MQTENSKCDFLLECQKCNRIYIPLENAGITPIAWSALIALSKEHPGEISPEFIQRLEKRQKEATPGDILQLSRYNHRKLPDIVFAGNQKNEYFKLIALDPGNFENTKAVLSIVDRKYTISLWNDPGSGYARSSDRYWRCNSCNTISPYRKEKFWTKSFGADTVREARERVDRKLPLDRQILVRVDRDDTCASDLGVTEEIVTGKNPRNAMGCAERRLAGEAHNFSVIRTVGEFRRDVDTIEGPTEWSATSDLCDKLGADSENFVVNNVKLERPPKKGFLGIGKQDGIWTIDWTIQAQYLIKYEHYPAKLTAFYNS